MNIDSNIIIGAIFASPLLSAVVTYFMTRKKTEVEARNLSITGETNIVGLYEKYALEQKKDREELRKELTDKIEELKKDHTAEIIKLQEEFARITNAKDGRIKQLENRVMELEKEVAKYKNIDHTIDTVADSIHESVDVASAQIKSDIKKE